MHVFFNDTATTESYTLSLRDALPIFRTVDGGTHETGFRNGITKAVRAYIDRRKLLPKDITGITGDDVREGLVAIINIYLQGDVEFQGQTKGRLNSEITSQVEAVINHTLEHYLNENQTLGNTLASRIILSAQARIASSQAKGGVQDTHADR